jgi:uncharacterized protein (DUF486 family)
MKTILLLTISNIFMTFAWYGHLKYRSEALWKVIMVSWGIAFFEYCFQVPANRIGSYEFSGAQLKTIQEVITLTVFSVFSVMYLGEKFRWNYAAGFGCIVLGAFFVFHKWQFSRFVRVRFLGIREIFGPPDKNILPFCKV